MYRCSLNCLFVAAALVTTAPGPAWADSVELTNGDVINGRVLTLDAKQLKLKSEVHGDLTITRDKIATITLGNRKPVKRSEEKADAGKERAADGGAGRPAALRLDQAGSLADVIKQLEAQGINPRDKEELQKAMPLLKNPEAQAYFDKTLEGLIKGETSIDDLRKQAIRARDDIKKSTKGLGPEVEQALSGYLNVLERFIEESAPPEEKGKPAEKARR